MSVLSDSIEIFIKELMAESGRVAVQRNELAQHFACAPSQINYVLATRFTLDRGYTIVSRRGGGGYILITRVDMERDRLLHQLALSIEGQLPLRSALSIIARLHEAGGLTDREAALMQAAMANCNLPTEELQNTARANVLRGMVMALLQGE